MQILLLKILTSYKYSEVTLRSINYITTTHSNTKVKTIYETYRFNTIYKL